MNNIASNAHIPMGIRAAEIKAIVTLLNYTVVDIRDTERCDVFSQPVRSIDKTWRQRASSNKNTRHVFNRKRHSWKLFRYGLNLKSFKKAGATPSSVLGMKYKLSFNGYFRILSAYFSSNLLRFNFQNLVLRSTN